MRKRVRVVACFFIACMATGTPARAMPQAARGAAAPIVANGGFDAAATKTDPVPGWTIAIGARNGGEAPLSEVSLDRSQKHGGKASLHLSATSATLAFRSAKQDLEVRAGGTYQLTAWVRTKNVRHEQNAKGINQFDNCYIALFLTDGTGESVGRAIVPLQRPDTDGWQRVSTELKAPAITRAASVLVFSSVSGDAWIDDIAVEIEGGESVPPPAPVFAEDFEALTELPPTWLVEEGARNGGNEPVSTSDVSVREGAGKSRHSLHLGGSAKTLRWNSVNRYFDAAPGDVFDFTAQVMRRKVHAEKNVIGVDQFTNLHMRLVFLDADGAQVGAPAFANIGDGDSDWSGYAVHAVAPEGAVRGMAGLFLSMSGDVWFDDILLTRQTGGVPAYAGWKQLATAHLVLRHAPDHPSAGMMPALGARFEEALARVAAALHTDIDKPITMFLYRDGEQGRSFTGRDLDFAEPERRAVHQRPNSTPSHELTHVVALGALGYAQTGLLGEGLAVWLDGQGADAHHDAAAALLREGKLPGMAALLKDFRGQSAGYPAAGSFCGWLLDTQGFDALRRLYPLSDPAAAAPAVVKQDWDALDAAWRAFLAARAPAGAGTENPAAPGGEVGR